MPLRRSAAVWAVRATAALSRRLHLGSGSTVGGRVGLAVDPGLLAAAGAGRAVALVSGTNGKTTTTRLLAAALGRALPGDGPATVATSPAGANLPPGLVTALLAEPAAGRAALEVDESYLGAAADALRPAAVVLLNLSRDQLDRVSEVRHVANRWRAALVRCPGVVVANADDPLVVWAAGAAPRVVFVGAGGRWRADAYHCPSCDARLAFAAGAPGWSCTCGFARPATAVELDGDRLVGAAEAVELRLSLPGRFNRANAALAAVAAGVLGVPLAEAVDAMRSVTDVAGRFATFPLGRTAVRLLLAKNPAGFDELLGLVAGGTGPVAVAVNARDADGHDPSWLWDVPFERLAHRYVVAGGERRLDLSVRLRHAGVAHEASGDVLATLEQLGPQAAGPLDVIANYTAFQELRRQLARAARSHAGTTPATPPAAGPEPDRPAPDGVAARVAPDRPAPDGVAARAAPDRPAPDGVAARAALGGRPRPSVLRVVVVHPDLLGTYGDGGNGLVLANRARWRGIEAELVLAPSDRPLPATGDLYCLGGGEDGPQARATEVLADGSLARAIDSGATVLAVCAGFQILGTAFPGADGAPRAGLGLLDVESVRTSEARAVGELLVDPPTGPLGDLGGPGGLTGFENHAARTRLGPAAAPLGTVRHGVGNGGGTDGALQGRVVGTYLHGPILARNAALADALLRLATGATLAPLDDEEEAALHAMRLAALRSPSRRRARVV